MAANIHRGEIEVSIDGQKRILCLTLGALAGLESHFGVGDLPALAEKFSAGQFSSDDLIAILHAGLVGGGNTLSLEDVREMRVENGAAGYAAITAELLAATFGQE